MLLPEVERQISSLGGNKWAGGPQRKAEQQKALRVIILVLRASGYSEEFEVVDFPSLAVLRARLDGALSKLV